MNKVTKSVMKVYDKIAEVYAKELWEDLQYKEYLDIFLSKVSGNEILDIGCAMGSFTKYVADKGYKTTGIDISRQMVKIAKRKVPYVKFKKMDMAHLKFRQKFDGIMSINSIIHIEKNRMIETLNGFKNCLKNNGVMLIILQKGQGEQMIKEPFDESLSEFVNLYEEKEIEEIFKKLEFVTLFKTPIFDQVGAASENNQIVYILQKTN